MCIRDRYLKQYITFKMSKTSGCKYKYYRYTLHQIDYVECLFGWNVCTHFDLRVYYILCIHILQGIQKNVLIEQNPKLSALGLNLIMKMTWDGLIRLSLSKK